MRANLSLLLAAAIIPALTPPALAVSIVVSNASFEIPSLPQDQFTHVGGPNAFTPEQSFAIPGWGGTLGYAPNGAIIVSAGVRNATNSVDGNQTLYITVHEEMPSPLATIWQDVGDVSPNTTYTLKVAAGGPLNGVADGAQAMIALTLNTWEGPALASTNFQSIGYMHGLSDYSCTCTTGPSTTGRLVISLTMFGIPVPSNLELNFDNVRLEAFTPPSLTIAPVDDGISLAWPSSATNYWLEATRQLSLNPTWLPVTNTGGLGTNQLVISTPQEASTFYRLRQ